MTTLLREQTEEAWRRLAAIEEALNACTPASPFLGRSGAERDRAGRE